MPSQSWAQTKLFSVLRKKRTTDAIQTAAVLSNWMPGIEKILSSASTSPLQFTLHDADHSFRVAERMAEIVPPETINNLSCYEIALLLLSAYLHDIGMTPNQEKVILHYNYLLTTSKSDKESPRLLQQDSDLFQAWLDEEERITSIPITVGVPTSADLQLANEITAAYCRHRHNDWSEEWIKKNINQEKLGSYNGWIDDLVILCRSHHEPKSELLKPRFNPRPVGSGSPTTIVHLRYLACVLRMADILEFDPERTPEVIFRTRNIPASSLIFWHKDHNITLVKEGERLTACARPNSAKIHRAIETMLDDIDSELLTCRTIAEETHFEICPGLRQHLPHRWALQNNVYRDLSPRDESYEYINGAFRPNTAKLLQILSGTQLYNSPFEAIRELLQNAFDAVKEQLAYQRLNSGDPNNPRLLSSLENVHKVELRLEERSDGPWIVCKDTGVGMTKRIITNFLLVSGQSKRHEITSLERRCNEHGFNLDRTGQFGIGVLSYFMIGDRVIITTQRSTEAGDSENACWRFETEGVGSFGDLRKSSQPKSGTTVELHIKQTLANNSNFYFELRGFVEKCLRRIPCAFELNSSLAGCPPLEYKAGWGDHFIQKSLMKDFGVLKERDAISHKLKPLRFQQERIESLQSWESLKSELQQAYRLITKEGILPHNLGSYRVHLIYFSLPDGNSIGFMKTIPVEGTIVLIKLDRGYYFYPSSGTLFSWKGMNLGNVYDSYERMRHLSGMRVEIDLHNSLAGEISANRSVFHPTKLCESAFSWLMNECQRLREEFIGDNRESPYASLNARLAYDVKSHIHDPFWIQDSLSGSKPPVWGKISLPFVLSTSWGYGEPPSGKLFWNGKRVFVLESLHEKDEFRFFEGLPIVSPSILPDHLLIHDAYPFNIIPVWSRNPFAKKRALNHCSGIPLPPAWKSLVGVHYRHYTKIDSRCTIWNSLNPLVKKATEESFAWLKQGGRENADPLLFKNELLGSSEKCAAWLLLYIPSATPILWEGLNERDPTFWSEIWKTLFPHNKHISLLFFEQGDTGGSTLKEVSSNSFLVHSKFTDLAKLLPDPGEKWTLSKIESQKVSASVKVTASNRRKT